MAKRILIMGLPGAGKTTLAAALASELFFNSKVVWLNADAIREKYNDWDFSHEGRIRQAKRMRYESSILEADFVIADFVCPLIEMREIYEADWTIWVDTIEQGRFEDTNKLFQVPEFYDFRITEQDADKWSTFIASHILNKKEHGP